MLEIQRTLCLSNNDDLQFMTEMKETAFLMQNVSPKYNFFLLIGISLNMPYLLVLFLSDGLQFCI